MMMMKRLNRGPKGIIIPQERKSERRSQESTLHRSKTSINSAVTHRRRILVSLPLLAIVLIFGSNLLSSLQSSIRFTIRRLTSKCIHSIYTTKALALNMPDFSKPKNLPAYVALCQELVRRDADTALAYDTNGSYIGYRLREDESICMDWTAPHYNVLEIFSSALLSNFLPQTSYRHDCYRTRQWLEEKIGCDATTIQQGLPLAFTEFNFDLVSKQLVIDQCKAVLANYDPTLEFKRVKSMTMRHPFLWPAATLSQIGDGKLPATLPIIPTAPRVIPLSGILIPLVARLERSSLDWMNVTLSPPHEEESGVIIHLDPSTIAIDPTILTRFLIGPSVVSPTSVTVLVPPICKTAYLQNGVTCWDYAETIVSTLQRDLPTIGESGFEKTPGIKLESPCSTAGSWSRLMRAKFVICLPNTPSCLLPALGKKPGSKTLFLEMADRRDATEFFSFAGSWNKVIVEVIDSSSSIPPRPPPSSALPDQAPDKEPVATAFTEIQQSIDPETGFPSALTPGFKETILTVHGIPSQTILSRFNQMVRIRPETNPNAEHLRREDLVSRSEVVSFHALSKPINDNYAIPIEELNGGDPKDVSSELGTDWMAGLSASSFDLASTYTHLKELRRASVARILQDNQLYQETVFKENSPNANLHIEVWCPLEGQGLSFENRMFTDTSGQTNNDQSGGGDPSSCDDGWTSLIWMDGSQMYNAMPIKVLSRDGQTVTFEVEQTWKPSGSVDSMFTLYHSNSNNNDNVACSKTQSIPWGKSVGSYTAVCEHGVSPVRVFVHDCTFPTTPNDVVVPSICGATDAEKTYKLGYTFEVPCTPSCQRSSMSSSSSSLSSDGNAHSDSTPIVSKELPISPPTMPPTMPASANPAPMLLARIPTPVVAPTVAPLMKTPSKDSAATDGGGEHTASTTDGNDGSSHSSGGGGEGRSGDVGTGLEGSSPGGEGKSNGNAGEELSPMAHTPTPAPIEPTHMTTPPPTVLLRPTLVHDVQATPKPNPSAKGSNPNSHSNQGSRRRLEDMPLPQQDAAVAVADGEVVLIPASEFQFGRVNAQVCSKYRKNRRDLHGVQQQQQQQQRSAVVASATGSTTSLSRAAQVFLARQQQRPKPANIVTLIKNYGTSSSSNNNPV